MTVDSFPTIDMDGRRVRLRALTPNDYGPLFAMNAEPTIMLRWRHRGTTVSFESFVQMLWRDVLAQFAIELKADGNLLGYVSSYNVDFRTGTGSAAVMVHPGAAGFGLAIEAYVLLLDYLFKNFNLRKIYGESLEFNYGLFSSGEGRLFVEEGRLRDHEFYHGRYWDNVIFAVYREAVEEHAGRLLGRGHHQLEALK
jgi:RimJ/RimL family protein N-acetyltransferase